MYIEGKQRMCNIGISIGLLVLLHGPSMFAVKAKKIMECSLINPAHRFLWNI